ncbi:hypothetical protein B0H14DRAFT_3439167 [Mycena olivaceomarginata]|nr:hypothetical protein B0H14DRAFT_3439167 [Mycena olivaceomarginata]
MSAPQGMAPILANDQDMSVNHHNLDSLRDGPPSSKPCYPYSTLIRYAIKGSPNQKLLTMSAC